MDNLLLHQLRRKELFDSSDDQSNQYAVNSLALDHDSKVGYFLAGNKILDLDLERLEITELEDVSAFLGESSHAKRRIVCSTFLLEDKLYFLLFDDGRIIIFDGFAKTVFDHQLELPGCLIDSAKFSHDQDLLVVTTNENMVLLFNRALSLQTMVDLGREDYGENEFINVNWGSKATQFHGTGMRDQRTMKQEFHPLSESDDKRATIAWRDDDNFFVVNHVSQQNNSTRQLKIFNRQGVLQHTSENIPGLEKNIAWRPGGGCGLIACSVRLPNKHLICFVEKNGLRHGEFELKESTQDLSSQVFDIDEVLWSHDGETLLVRGSFASKEESGRQEIRLFAQSNYYWYVKQIIPFGNSSGGVVGESIENIVLDQHNSCGLHCIENGGRRYSFRRFEKRVCSTTNDNQVLVIDGSTLNISTFEHTLVPPPMCNYSLSICDGTIVNVFTSVQETSTTTNEQNKNDRKPSLLGIVTSTDHLLIFEQQHHRTAEELANAALKKETEMTGKQTVKYKFQNVSAKFGAQIPVLTSRFHVPGICEVRQPRLLSNGRFVGLIDDGKVGSFDYKQQQQQSQEIKCSDFTSATGGINQYPILHWCPIPGTEKALCFHGPDRPLALYSFEDSTFEVFRTSDTHRDVSYHTDLEWLMAVDSASTGSELSVLALTKNNCLYIDERQIVPDGFVTSVFVFDFKYLLFTSNDMFSCFPLRGLKKSITSSANSCDVTKLHSPRVLERGSRIISVSINEAKVVLQMPRGNLEQFHPRVLILDQVRTSLQAKNYLRAFELLRRNRIDLNCLCDYDFEQFSADISLFVQQIPVDWVCLFLSDLSDRPNVYLEDAQFVKDSSKMIFDSNENEEAGGDEAGVTKCRMSKTNKVCEKMESEISRLPDQERRKLLNPLLLSHIRRDPPRIDSALRLVASLQTNAEREKALDFMLYSVKSDRLYDEALGTYDFDILLMVTSKCSRDPKESMALRGEFEAIEDVNYRRAKIDLHLRRWESALEHLSLCSADRYDELIHLIEERNLFSTAIQLFGLNDSEEASDRHPAVWNVYGEYLLKKKYHKEAGLTFQRAKNWSQAIKMFLIAGDAQRALDCADNFTQNDDAARHQHYENIAGQLTLNSEHFVAGWVYETYLADYRASFEQYLAAQKWTDALRCVRRLSNSNNEKNPLSNNTSSQEPSSPGPLQELRSELINFYNSILGSINGARRTLAENVQRLDELKANKMAATAAAAAAFAADGTVADFEHHPDMDAYSDTSSLADSVSSNDSLGSRASLRTNKSSASMKRKQKKVEQRKYQLRRGSPNEDLQIIYALKELIVNTLRVIEGVDTLIVALFEHFFAKQSAKLQNSVCVLFAELRSAVDGIWNSPFYSQRIAEDELLRNVPELPTTGSTSTSSNVEDSSSSGVASSSPSGPAGNTKWTIVLNSTK